jgi:CheY-like chemotaxis protein
MYQEYSDSTILDSVDSSPPSYFFSKSLKILIAEDETDIGNLYKTALEMRNHQAIVTTNGEDCLKVYHEVCQSNRFAMEQQSYSQPSCSIKVVNSRPFDVVLLDCNLPYINGIEVAKEISAVNPHQRIIFASAYVKETLTDSIKELKQVVELMQKPFGEGALIDTIEDKDIYQRLQKFNVDIDIIKAINPTHEQIVDLLERLQRIQKHTLGLES